MERILRIFFGFLQKILVFFRKTFQSKNVVFMFHKIYEQNNESLFSDPYSISDNSFELFVKNLQSQYSIISISSIFEHTKNRFAIITFDDVHESFYNKAYPILSQYHIPFTLFVTACFINKPGYLTEDMITRLISDELCTFGVHGYEHRILRFLSKKEQRIEIEEGKRTLEKKLGYSIEYFAYPYGSIFAIPRNSKKIVANAGFVAAFSTISSRLARGDLKSRFFLSRINVNELNYCRILKMGDKR